MRTARILMASTILITLAAAGCGKSSKLGALLPDAPAGWKSAGSNYNDVGGVGHSAARTYVPTSAGSSVAKVTVQILVGEKGADHRKVQQMSVQKEPTFMEAKDIAGYPAYESAPIPDDPTHTVYVLPKTGVWVIIMLERGGAGWEKPESRRAAISAFVAKLDWKKIAALE